MTNTRTFSKITLCPSTPNMISINIFNCIRKPFDGWMQPYFYVFWYTVHTWYFNCVIASMLQLYNWGCGRNRWSINPSSVCSLSQVAFHSNFPVGISSNNQGNPSIARKPMWSCILQLQYTVTACVLNHPLHFMFNEGYHTYRDRERKRAAYAQTFTEFHTLKPCVWGRERERGKASDWWSKTHEASK